ncbi:hypothetical protein SLNSH_17450 [Alsobacter soli]|uniref:Uncharacterized protein n=1 Tax=Alsobacter soli TaxID=2109933 RepID=A0A2T1HQ08_9HYPH|nr:hypothetical protein [Alsobacter soli]PSC03730.1 hypothetical protein SLNSH_17450 [Alsobacter soli]
MKARLGAACAAALIVTAGTCQAGDLFNGRVPVSGPFEPLVVAETAPAVYPDYTRRAPLRPVAVINRAGVLYNQPFPVYPAAVAYPAIISARY